MILNFRNLPPLFIFLVFFILFFAISIYRYDSAQLFHYDFGIFASIIWQLSQGKIAIINHISLGRIIFLGDHFQPSLAILSPLFWIVKDVRILLAEQAFVLAASSFLIYLIALRKSLSKWSALIFSIIFLLYAGIEFPVVSDWHPEPTAGLFLLLFIYFFLYSKRKIIPLILAIIFLGFKESNALTLSFFLISSLFIYPKRLKEILFYLGSCLLWFFGAINIFIPFFAHRSYFYAPQLPKNIVQLGESFGDIKKYNFVVQSILSFGFLPFFAKFGLIPVIGEIMLRILPLRSFFQNFTLGLHYNVYLGIFLALATLNGFIFIINKFQIKKYNVIFACIFFAFSVFVAKRITISPVVVVTNKIFWQELKPREEIFQSLSKVPSQGSIASQNNLLPYLVLRNDNVVLIDKGYRTKDPQIIVFDLTAGQNPNNFFPKDYNFFVQEKNSLEKHSSYKRLSTNNKNFYIYVKK